LIFNKAAMNNWRNFYF